MFKLRPYQQHLVDENKRLWSEGVRNPCTVLSTGGGKTVVAAELIRQEQQAGGYFAAIAHRQELVGQISLALARQGVMHDIVAPRPVIRFCSNLHVEEVGQSFYSQHAPGFVGGVNTVIRRDLKRIKDAVSLVFQDECFPAGTLITMSDGTTKPIEDVTIGDEVQAFDDRSSTFHKRKVEHLYVNPAPEKLVRIEVYSGVVLYCTPNHPIWVSRHEQREYGEVRNAWLEAVQLISGQIIKMAQHIFVNGCFQRIKSARYVSHKHDKVYNFAVEELHTYIANGVVVHNCHHVLRENLWGKAAALFPKANGLYVTATPLRADGKGLGRHADGLFDQFIFGPPMRQLIREGSLTDYKIYAPPTDVDLTAMKFGSDGDFSRPELVKRAKKSGIVGDVVTNYAKYCNGVQTVVFVVDVEQAKEVATALESNGVRAVALSANNTDAERQEAISAFKRKEIQVIVNVDLLGEGFDCPAIECVIMARPTASYGLYSQQFGRAIRILPGKDFGLIIDMVGNVKRHGLPDAPREWSLDRREKRGKSESGDAAVKTCSECMGVYSVGPTSCPYCGHTPIAGAGGRGELVIVDAELRELTPEELAEMRGEADKLSKEWNVPYGGSKTHIMAAISHNKTVVAQRELREAVALYAGAFRAMGVPDEMIHVQMWQSYGTNVSQLQTLRPKDANALRERIVNDLNSLGVTP